MAKGGFKQLTRAQKLALHDLLEAYPEPVGEEGEALLDEGAVRRLWWDVPQVVLQGEVWEYRSVTVTLILHPELGVEDAHCTCDGDYICRHIVAVCLAALENRYGEGKPAAGTGQATTESGPPASSTRTPARTTPPPPAPELPAPVSSLEKFLAVQCGGSLNRREVDLAAAIEAFWRLGSSTTTDQHLRQLGGHTGYFYGWRPEIVQVWPEHRPPSTAIDAFYYIAHALRIRDKLPNLRLFTTVNWAEVDRLVAPWNRELEVVRWRKELSRLSLVPRDRLVSASFRLRLDPEGATVEWQPAGRTQFEPVKISVLRECGQTVTRGMFHPDYPLDEVAKRFLSVLLREHPLSIRYTINTEAFTKTLSRLLREPGFEGAVVTPTGEPIARESSPLRWEIEDPVDPGSTGTGDYHVVLRQPDGSPVPASLATLEGRPTLYVLPDRVFELSDPLIVPAGKPPRLAIPAGAVESEEGVAALQSMQIQVPERLASRVDSVPYTVEVRCRIEHPGGSAHDQFQLKARASIEGPRPDEMWNGVNWEAVEPTVPAKMSSPAPTDRIICPDRSTLHTARQWIREAGMETWGRARDGTRWHSRRLQGASLREFPEFFCDWLGRLPPGISVELDPELAALRDGTVAGMVRLDVKESGVDWFDLRVALDVSDVELTTDEIDLLLKANGRWVRLPGKGWRRLEFQLSDEDQAQLADLGLAVGDLARGETQRMHVFQLAGAAGTRLLPPERAVEVKRRAEELRTRVTPELPAAITASLRPYQLEGYHFLAYLSANRFGGILADDMGLGKTVQTLSWLAWLRETGQLDGPALVVCPKSVQDNWRGEVARFYPGFRVRVWNRETAGAFEDAPPAPPAKKSARKKSPAPPPIDDLVIINYTQLRLHEEALLSKRWSAVILDEAQYIKNPSSQTSKAACALQAGHRLALSGTPIENRLLDLWSIMNFAMPGVLGNRSAFSRTFNGKDDPLARRRLSARVRPFVLRRTKKEVAKDLPDRIEEEIVCELEGLQATLYRAELKRARATLLKAKTSSQLDKLRFNILTSLLRLRQICCHPALVGAGKPGDDSAKLAALLDLLEPLIEEGHKVLVFSQFVEMLELIRAELAQRDWPHLVLTGQTEDRGALVDRFQQTDGASVFLISLKAGGFGLNLTAASYVVLFDPWWNPAVENQAIDRTHRIGQVNKVIAYRLLVRETIEEKIRKLQNQKNALASDILGEESFAKALTLDDFRFLLSDGEETPSQGAPMVSPPSPPPS